MKKTQSQARHALVLTAGGFLPPNVPAFRDQERKRSCDTSRSEGEAGAEFKESHPGPSLGYKC